MKAFCCLIFFFVFEVLIIEGDEEPDYNVVDLTHPFDETTLGWPHNKKFHLTVIENGTTKEGYWLQSENYESSIHTGTHMDAPCRNNPGRWCLDKIPIKRFFGNAAVVDITRRTGGNNPYADAEIQDFLNWEAETGKSLNYSVVLVRTGWDLKWNNPEEYLGLTSYNARTGRFPGISPIAAQWLASNRKIYGIGIDTTSLDNGLALHRKSHEAFYDANIYGLENVADLYKLPIDGAILHVFPMKITGASGAPVRIIAYIP